MVNTIVTLRKSGPVTVRHTETFPICLQKKRNEKRLFYFAFFLQTNTFIPANPSHHWAGYSQCHNGVNRFNRPQTQS